MRTVELITRRSSFICLLIVLVMADVLAGCGNNPMGEAQTLPPSAVVLLPSAQPTDPPIVQPTPTLFVPEPLLEPYLVLSAGPREVALELEIPSLDVVAPVLGVGLTSENVMDSPKGPINDPVWASAFWYRGSGIPGASGTATIAGHVNDPLGRSMIFAHLEDLEPGDLIIIRDTRVNVDMLFHVDQVKRYSVKESSDPAVLAQIFGAGPVAGTGPQPAPDGLSHLTLITCAGYIVDGQFDHHIVVYATRSE